MKTTNNTVKIKILHIVTVLIFPLFMGCEKFLDLSPQSEISDPVYWSSKKDFQLAANWFYANALDDPNYNDNNTDISFGTGVSTISSGTNIAPESDGNWDNAYRNIRNANKLIIEGEGSVIKDEISAYLGEGYFFRAYDYFKLLKFFGGVPIINKVLQPTDPEVFGERASRETVMDSILSDLDKAISYLPIRNSVETGRICKEAAQALKSRICLFEGTWRKYHQTGDAASLLDIAAKEAKNVIESDAYSLYGGKAEESYRYMFIDGTSENNVESIIVKKYRLNINAHGFIYSVSWGNLNPTKKMADLYLCTDGRPIETSSLFQDYDSCRTEFRNRDPRMTQSFILPAKSIIRPQYDAYRPQWPGVDNNRNVNSGYMLYKFISEVPTPGPNATGPFDWNILRYAEVLLNYAEAVFEKDGVISDADLDLSINKLRDRVNMPHLTNSFVNSNGLDMKMEIRRERTVELAFEGFRWDDLRRWKTAEIELPHSILSVKVTGTEWAKETITIDENNYQSRFFNMPSSQLENGYKVLQPGAQRSFDADKNYLLPIPTNQISLNDDLEQNPGW